MKQASIPNEACFIRQQSLLRLASKPIAFLRQVWFNCGLTILVDHFKLYLYYELTQLLLIDNSR